MTRARWGDGVFPTSYLSPSRGFDVYNCRSEELFDLVRVAANEVRLSLCKLQRDTLDAGLQRLDASDHMPEVIGGDWLGGAFMQGMADWIVQGPDSLDEVLADIEEARSEVVAQTEP